MPMRVTLLTRAGCHLCEGARDVVRAECDAADVAWQEIDVDEVPPLKERYADEVPVVIVDGEVVGFWRIDPARLRSALA